MLVFGKNVAYEFLSDSDKVINKIYLNDRFNDEKLLDLIQKRNITLKKMSKFEIDKLASGNNQGIILDVPDYEYVDISLFTKKEDSLVIILDHLEDPHNLGAIIRTAEAAGADGIIIPKDRSTEVNSTSLKVSAGAIENIDIARVTNLVRSIDYLKKEGFWIVGTDMDGTSYDEIDYNGKIAIVIGNEGKGMSKSVKDACDFVASIPMRGKVNSLNASVSAAIVIYEAIKCRR